MHIKDYKKVHMPASLFLSAEMISVYQLLLSYLMIGLMLKNYGKMGLLTYAVIALIIADLQVCCAAPFTSYGSHLVLGTVVYTSLFLVNDLTTELYGLHTAKRFVALTMMGHLLLIFMVRITLLYPDLPDTPETHSYVLAKDSLRILFEPQMSLFIASQIAYFVSQWIEIHIFSSLRKKIPQFLALRGFISVFLGILIDAGLFNMLAWEILAKNPVPLDVLWSDYICANIVIQWIILFINIPAFYVLLWFYRTSFHFLWQRFSFFLPQYRVAKGQTGDHIDTTRNYRNA